MIRRKKCHDDENAFKYLKMSAAYRYTLIIKKFSQREVGGGGV
jgi:hypothetical protein